MNSLKNGFVIAVMLAAGYGVYVMLNRPPGMPSADAPYNAAWTPSEVQLSTSEMTPPAVSIPGNGDSPASANSLPGVAVLPQVSEPAMSEAGQQEIPPTQTAAGSGAAREQPALSIPLAADNQLPDQPDVGYAPTVGAPQLADPNLESIDATSEP